jgi:hypothetical protein
MDPTTNSLQTTTNPNTQPTATPDVIHTPDFREAYEQTLAEIRAVPESELAIINVDIPSAITTVSGALPEIQALRSRIAQMPEFDLARFDKLHTYALAAGYAHALYMLASAPTESIDELSASAAALRELLFADATSLATHGVIDGEKLKELKGPLGFRNQAFDLLALSAHLRANWAAIAGRTPLQMADLDKAVTLSNRLVTAVGLREQGPAIVAEAQDNRHRAFTLFFSTYDDTRRAISFLRWKEDDVDSIAPSLYAGRGGRGKTAAPKPVPTPPVGPTTNPAPTPPTGAPAAAPAGHPDSEPFVRA